MLNENPIRNEKEVEELLLKPLLRDLGWTLDKSNCQVWIPLTHEKALFWRYSLSRRRMCRDYILRDSNSELHIEAKHSWDGWKMNMQAFLLRVNRGDFTGTDKDGCEKDLALLLWGAESCGGRKAAVIDEARLMVFERNPAWRILADASRGDAEAFQAAARLLRPALA